MKTLKSRVQKTKSLISIKTYKKPQIFIVLLMLLINVVIVLVSALIAVSIDDSYTSFFDALTNGSIKWLLTPNAILQIVNPRTLILATFVLITGMILFSGVIIALTTNLIREYINNKKTSSGKLIIENHVIIINWNSKVSELVSDLLYIENKKINVVVISSESKEYIEKHILNALSRIKKQSKFTNLNVLVKQADPLLKTNLTDISVEKAQSIIIMNTSNDLSDIEVIKNILSLNNFKFDNNPSLVVEMKDINSTEKIETLNKVMTNLKDNKILPVVFDYRLGQIIAQTLIESKIKDVYLSLFSFKDSEIYFIPNKKYDDVLNYYTHSIPLAENEAGTFVLSEDTDVVNKKTNTIINPIKLKINKINLSKDYSIYILGKNNKLNYILESLKGYQKVYSDSFSCSFIELEELKNLVKKLNETNEKAKILLLSNEENTKESIDENVINALIYFEQYLKNENVELIVELLNPKNEYIVSGFNINNTIISNKLVSLLLSKFALFTKTTPYYDMLLSREATKNELPISILLAKELIQTNFPLEFSSTKELIVSFYESYKAKKIPIGVFRNDELIIFSNNLHEEKFTIYESDEIILINIKKEAL